MTKSNQSNFGERFSKRISDEVASRRTAARLQREDESRSQETERLWVEAQKESTQSPKSQYEEQDRQRKKEVPGEAEQDRRHPGTIPSTVLSPEDARLCRDFVAYMGQRAFSGATKLVHRPFLIPTWSIRGYGVGDYAIHSFTKTAKSASSYYEEHEGGTSHTYTPAEFRTDRLTGSKLDDTVFLCEDGLLRAYVNSKAARHIESYTQYREEDASPNTICELDWPVRAGQRNTTTERGLGMVTPMLESRLIAYAAEAEILARPEV